jgi:hypothetical protein
VTGWDYAAAAAAVCDPATSPATLRQIAAAWPALRTAIQEHPAYQPGLVDDLPADGAAQPPIAVAPPLGTTAVANQALRDDRAEPWPAPAGPEPASPAGEAPPAGPAPRLRPARRRRRPVLRVAVAALLVAALAVTALVWWRWQDGQRALTEDQFNQLGHVLLGQEMGATSGVSVDGFTWGGLVSDASNTASYPGLSWTWRQDGDPLNGQVTYLNLGLYPSAAAARRDLEAWQAWVEGEDNPWDLDIITAWDDQTRRQSGVTLYAFRLRINDQAYDMCGATVQRLAIYRNVMAVGTDTDQLATCAEPVDVPDSEFFDDAWIEYATGPFKAAVDKALDEE